jgi:drug/metabolite transporter (DMT)-like permease
MDVLFALLTSILFGLLAVTIRLALPRVRDSETGAVAATLLCLAVCVVAAVIAVAAGATGPDGGSWRYLVLGAVAPGLSQIVYVRALGIAGPSRTGVLLAASPIFAAFIAIAWRDEPFGWGLGAATALIVLGGSFLAREGTRPEGFRAVGLLLALLAGILYGVQGNILRWAADGSGTDPIVAASLFTASGLVLLAGYHVALHGVRAIAGIGPAIGPFVPAGIVYGLSYVCIALAYANGRVVVVSPLIATSTIFTVAATVALMGRRADAVGGRVVAATAFVVAGGVLVGLFR